MNAHFDTLLVANRGEIACRILRSARAMGLRTIAVHAAADRNASHVSQADEALELPGDAPLPAYLSIEAIIAACRRSGAQAVHPGYGFLAENAGFARACEAAGIVFVGPSPEAIEQLGNKARAKQLAHRLGIPCLPGYAGADQSADTLAREAVRIGTPLMIKASAGGGGRGMRRVDDLADFAALAASARSEASAAFGDAALLLEKLVEGARHVEIQVLADRFGHCIHLGERDCSTQRRHQKLIEEAPAPGVSAPLREAMGDAAVRLARAAGYVGAGTVEFLLSPDGSFHFLEVNTRLQVEHAVTEAITGIDLVEMQLRIARGESLDCTQGALRIDGHAIEARLCAEDAFHDFAPQSGPILAWRLVQSPNVRIDHALSEGASVSPHFDSMIARIIAWGRDRDEARRRLLAALDETSVLGVTTNRAFLQACLRAPAFVEAGVHTGWLQGACRTFAPPLPGETWRATAAALWMQANARAHGALANWSSSGPRATHALLGNDDGERWSATVTGSGDTYRVKLDSREIEVRFDAGGSVTIDGRRQALHALHCTSPARPFQAWLDVDGCSARFIELAGLPLASRGPGSGADVHAGMHGQVASLSAAVGDTVQPGQRLLAIEAMKMEFSISAPIAGRIAEMPARIGAQVSPATLLVRIDPPAASGTAAGPGAPRPGDGLATAR